MLMPIILGTLAAGVTGAVAHSLGADLAWSGALAVFAFGGAAWLYDWQGDGA